MNKIIRQSKSKTQLFLILFSFENEMPIWSALGVSDSTRVDSAYIIHRTLHMYSTVHVQVDRNLHNYTCTYMYMYNYVKLIIIWLFILMSEPVSLLLNISLSSSIPLPLLNIHTPPSFPLYILFLLNIGLLSVFIHTPAKAFPYISFSSNKPSPENINTIANNGGIHHYGVCMQHSTWSYCTIIIIIVNITHSLQIMLQVVCLQQVQ